MTIIHHVRVTGTAGGVWIGETGELVLTVIVYDNAVGKGLYPPYTHLGPYITRL